MARLLSDKKTEHPSPRRIGGVPPGMPLTHIAQRVFNTPLLIYGPKLEAILHAIGPRLGMTSVPKVMEFDDDMIAFERREEPEQSGPVAVIPVYGTLVKRGGYLDSMSGLTSYDSLKAAVMAAMSDSKVKSLLFDFDSPGGEAAGLFDFAGWLAGQRGQKPMIGISNDSAFSAAYAIASCCDRLFVTGVGGVGSIGVYMLHTDVSEADKQMGVKYTYIKSGANKADGNPHEPLEKSVKAKMQAEVDRIRDMFVQLVAQNRGAKADDVYNTEADIYMGSAGIPLLADAICCYDEAAEYALSASSAKRTILMPKNEPAEPVLQRTSSITTMRTSFMEASFSQYTANVARSNGDEVLLAGRRFGSMRLDAGASEHGRISGILAPYDALSRDLGGFRETYAPGCFKKSLEGGADPLILAYHDPSKVLGRKSAGTAKFWEEQDGLHYQVDLPGTQDATDLKKSIERGDVRGASAAFFIERYRWETRGGDRVRVIEQAELVEGSPHSFVAYDDTTANAGQADAAAMDELIGTRLRLLKTT